MSNILITQFDRNKPFYPLVMDVLAGLDAVEQGAWVMQRGGEMKRIFVDLDSDSIR